MDFVLRTHSHKNDLDLIFLISILLSAIACSNGLMETMLEISPSSQVVKSSKVTLVCHSPGNLPTKSYTLMQNYQKVLIVRKQNYTLVGQWRSRKDIDVAMHKTFIAIKLTTSVVDSGSYSCETEFTGDKRISSEQKKLLVGYKPQEPKLSILLKNKEVEWIPEAQKFRITCSCTNGIPNADIIVRIGGIKIDGIISTHGNDIIFRRELTAEPVLNGKTLTCQMENPFGRTLVINKPLSVRYIRNTIIVSQQITAAEEVEVDQNEGHIIVCTAGGVPSPVLEWTYVSGTDKKQEHFKSIAGILEITKDVPVGKHAVKCRAKFQNITPLERVISVKVSPPKEGNFSPNVVAILFGVFLAISIVINAIIGGLLYRIYREDETWNCIHRYRHIPIKQWVNKHVV